MASRFYRSRAYCLVTRGIGFAEVNWKSPGSKTRETRTELKLFRESCENQVHAGIALCIKASCKSGKTSADLNSIFVAATPKSESSEEGVRTTDVSLCDIRFGT